MALLVMFGAASPSFANADKHVLGHVVKGEKHEKAKAIYKAFVEKGVPTPRMKIMQAKGELETGGKPGIKSSYDIKATQYPNQLYDYRWDRIDFYKKWDQGYKGQGVKVAVLDTGIDFHHPDLDGPMVDGSAGCVSFIEGENCDDFHGHGTHVAGLIAAEDNDFATVGVAPGVQLHSVKVLNRNGEGTQESVIAGIDWAISHKMDVINMSLGSDYHDMTQAERDIEKAAVDRAVAAGIVVVAASGNGGDRNVNSPALWANSIAVGGLEEDIDTARTLGWTYFSSYGPEVDLSSLAWTESTCPMDQPCYGDAPDMKIDLMWGTSMASPQVAAMAALFIQQNPTASVATIRSNLQSVSTKWAVDIVKPPAKLGKDEYTGVGFSSLDNWAGISQ